MRSNEILIVDDEIGIRELLLEILQDEGYNVKVAENANQARLIRNQLRPDLVLLDIWMPDCDGITLLKEWARGGQLTMPVVMMSGHGTIDTAVEATRIGAFDFMEKPIAMQKLLSTVGRALKQGGSPQRHNFPLTTLGKSELIENLKKRLDQVVNLKTPILLTGEPGVGFEACGRYLHFPNTPWVVLDNNEMVADAPLELLQQARDGLFFIKELENLTRRTQQGLLIILNKLEKYNARLVCASAAALPQMVAVRTFDPALFNMLSSLMITVPSLREHREDISELANHHLAQLIESKKLPPKQFSMKALNLLTDYEWPGNIEQLHNVINNLAFTSLHIEIDAPEVSQALAQFTVEKEPVVHQSITLDLPLREARDKFEQIYLEHHIKLENGNMSRVAEKIGLERTHLYRKLKQLGIRLAKKADS